MDTDLGIKPVDLTAPLPKEKPRSYLDLFFALPTESHSLALEIARKAAKSQTDKGGGLKRRLYYQLKRDGIFSSRIYERLCTPSEVDAKKAVKKYGRRK
jgi:hypothetical protein